MKILNDVTQIIAVIVSIVPFVAVGYYFGNLDKKVKENTNEIKEVKKIVHSHGLILLKNSEKN